MARLGIDGPVRRLAIEEGGGIRSWRGRLLLQLDLQELRRARRGHRDTAPSGVALGLARPNSPCDMRLGARCIGFEQMIGG